MKTYQFTCKSCGSNRLRWARLEEVTLIYPVKVGEDDTLIPDTDYSEEVEGGDVISDFLYCGDCGIDIDAAEVKIINRKDSQCTLTL